MSVRRSTARTSDARNVMVTLDGIKFSLGASSFLCFKGNETLFADISTFSKWLYSSFSMILHILLCIIFLPTLQNKTLLIITATVIGIIIYHVIYIPFLKKYLDYSNDIATHEILVFQEKKKHLNKQI